MTTHVTGWILMPFSSLALCSAIALSDFILTLNSKPIRMIRELINTSIITTIIVPMEPYSTLKRPKLVTKAEKPIVDKMLKKVAIMAPGETRLHRLSVDGAYL